MNGAAGARIAIVGGGFGGVTLAQALGGWAQVTVISEHNHLVFSPMLAEAAARTVSPLHIVTAGREMVPGARWLTARVTAIDRAANAIEYLSAGGERGRLTYDHLCLACGSRVDLNAVPGLAAHAYPLKTMGDALQLGNDVIGRLEEAAVESDPAERRRLLTVVVIGGGFSGVEVAGEMQGLLERTRRYYPGLRGERPRIVLLHRGEQLLPELQAPSLSAFAERMLRKRGLEVRTREEAVEVTATRVRLASGESLPAGLVVCTVGTAPNELLTALGLPLQRGRLETGPDLRVAGTANVWALGDCAAIPNAHDGKTCPPTAQFAVRQARLLAANLRRAAAGEPTQAFRYRPLGMLASIGRRDAVAKILGVHLSGFVAWFLWRGIYLGKLPTVSRKLEVAIDWAWQLLFPPNMVQLEMRRTRAVAPAHYSAGEYVFHRGECGDRFYIVTSGRAGVYLDDRSPPVAILEPGDHFGEGALFGRDGVGRRSASVKAETPLDLMALERDDFRRLAGSLRALRSEVERSVNARKGYAGFLAMLQREPGLRELRVRDLMSSPAECLTPETTLAEAIARFHNGRPGYPVAGPGGVLSGYCGRADLYEAMRGMLPLDTPVRAFMRPAPPALAPQQPVSDAGALLIREQIEIVPVVEGGRIAGVLSPIDLFRRAAAGMQAQPVSNQRPTL